MTEWVNKNVLNPITPKWLLQMAVSLTIAALIMLLKPLGMNFSQSATVAGVLLAVIWWTLGTVKKVPASLFLLIWFCLFSGAPAKTIFTFPLGETFIMLIATYIFSRSISNCGMIDKLLMPVLVKFCSTPFRFIMAVIATFFATIYIIPQPMSRLLLVAVVFDSFLKRTSVPKQAQVVLMYSVFTFYSGVNIACRDADLIMNSMAANSGAVMVSNSEWMKAMFVPTIGYLVVITLIFLQTFGRELKGVSIKTNDADVETKFSENELRSVMVIAATVLLWMTSPLWGKNILLFGYITVNTVITICAVIALFITGGLQKKDIAAADPVTLTFLAAAFSIGGVMKACGAAEVIFGNFARIFPAEFSIPYLMLMVLVSMLLHMVLGSITTTLSVVVPGLTLICQGVVSPYIIVYAAILGASYHAILPFHSVTLMVGASSGYFPTKYVTKLGIISTPFVFLAAAFIYLPYWRFIGLI